MNVREQFKVREKAIKLLKKAGYKKRTANHFVYENQVVQACKDLLQIKMISGQINDMTEECEILHEIAFPTDADLADPSDAADFDNFMFFLQTSEIIFESATIYANVKWVRFIQVASLSPAATVARSARWIEIAHAFGGRYQEWTVECDEATRSFTEPRFADKRPVRGANWHIFRNILTAGFTDGLMTQLAVVPEFYAMNDHLKYRDKASNSTTAYGVSELTKTDVDYILDRVRNHGEKLGMLRLEHFSDEHIEAVKEILKNRLYSNYGNISFTELAYISDSYESRLVAKELAFHAIEVGENFIADWIGNDEKNHTDLGKVIHSEWMFRSLSSELTPATGTPVKRKLKI